MNHVVSGCNDCCLLNTQFDSYGCGHYSCNYTPLNALIIETDMIQESPITPIDCPLKKESIIIVFDDGQIEKNNKGILAVENTDSQIAEDIEYLPPLSKLTEVFIKDNENKTK